VERFFRLDPSTLELPRAQPSAAGLILLLAKLEPRPPDFADARTSSAICVPVLGYSPARNDSVPLDASDVSSRESPYTGELLCIAGLSRGSPQLRHRGPRPPAKGGQGHGRLWRQRPSATQLGRNAPPRCIYLLRSIPVCCPHDADSRSAGAGWPSRVLRQLVARACGDQQ